MVVIGSGERRVRSDIQALRGYAVLVVILFHANLGIASSGYLGVDAFFVISGYLISGIIMRELAKGRFSFQDFYLRRVRRLLPASFVVLAATLLAAMFLITPSGWQHLTHQLYGVLGFATNIVLWKQINYFNDLADFEPLLHMWSLAVEEQFYLLLPITLRIIPRRWWLTALAVTTVISLASYLWLYPRSPGATFYLLPTRAWEIGIGAVATIFQWPQVRPTLVRGALAALALVLLGVLPFIDPAGVPSHFLAVPTTLAVATLLAINAQPSVTIESLIRPLRWFGDRSYSLYLLHWPLFAFAHNIYLKPSLPTWLALTLIGATIVSAGLLYHFIEEPVRRRMIPARRIWLMLIVGSAILATAAFAGRAYQASIRPALDLDGVFGLNLPACAETDIPFTGRCGQGTAPSILV